MTNIHFLIDDASQCRTQKAVLLAFASALEECAVGKVIRSSNVSELEKWDEVPSESSRRLALRIMAFQPAHDLLTAFLPGHVIPGSINSVFQQSTALTAQRFTTIADLDLFTIDNAHSETQLFHDFATCNQDYESIGRYDRFKVATLPSELISGGLSSALLLTNRPWYSAFSPARLQWLSWVKQAIDQGLLDFSAVERDVQDGLVRPSLLSDVKALLNDGFNSPLPDLTLDSMFVAPERRLVNSQHRLLYSEELQNRTIEYAKRNSHGKLRKLSMLGKLKYHILRLPHRLSKFGYQLTYKAYSVLVRPVVVWMRQKSGATR